jgi:Zn-dependent protease
MPSPPLLQPELPLRGIRSDFIRNPDDERRKTPLQQLGDRLFIFFLPVLKGLFALVDMLGSLRRVPPVVWTVGSALISIAIYSSRLGWKLSAGFITLLMVHELGHVAAARYYGISISTPLFLPYLGAFLAIKQPLRNAFEEAVLGISGPLLGTIGSLACWGVSHVTGSLLFAEIAFGSMIMNLVNLTPLGFLDGGHVAALFHKRIWIIGYLIMAVMAWYIRAPMMILSLFIMLPMVIGIFFKKSRENRFAQGQDDVRVALSRRLIMGTLYLGLIALLAASVALIFVKDIAPSLEAGQSLTPASSSPVGSKGGC